MILADLARSTSYVLAIWSPRRQVTARGKLPHRFRSSDADASSGSGRLAIGLRGGFGARSSRTWLARREVWKLAVQGPIL